MTQTGARNWNGSTLMLVILIGATLFVSNEFAVWQKWLGAALGIMLIALAFNASRAAFATLAFGIVLIVAFVRGMNLREKIKWAGAGAVLPRVAEGLALVHTDKRLIGVLFVTVIYNIFAWPFTGMILRNYDLQSGEGGKPASHCARSRARRRTSR